MILSSLEEVLQYLQLIDPGEAEYARNMIVERDVHYNFEHRSEGELILENENDTFMICKGEVWSRVKREGTNHEIYIDSEINSAIYISKNFNYCVVIGEDFIDIEEHNRKVPPL